MTLTYKPCFLPGVFPSTLNLEYIACETRQILFSLTSLFCRCNHVRCELCQFKSCVSGPFWGQEASQIRESKQKADKKVDTNEKS